jgi:hypothetical protein
MGTDPFSFILLREKTSEKNDKNVLFTNHLAPSVSCSLGAPPGAKNEKNAG